MTLIEIQNEVYYILLSMGLPQKAITQTASFQKDLGLDSLDFAELVMEIEFRLQLDIPSVEMEKITTVKGVIDYLYSLEQHFPN